MMLFLHCLVYNALAVSALLPIMVKNPRYMMQDYPAEITEGLEGKTVKEKKESFLFGLPFISILFLYPLIFSLYGKLGLHYTFFKNWMAVLVIALSFNVVDLLILDWLIFCSITPGWMVIPGTEGNPGYKNYLYHFIGFLKGCVFSVAGSIIFAAISEAAGLILK
ncbi:MAG: hypothetical protein JW760_14880 [Spirochaetales bacterium]|nr:hypothetical protein [Spirochaetales bacterium]